LAPDDIPAPAVAAPDAPAPRDAAQRIRWPLLFDLEPVAASYAERSSRRMTFAADVHADPDRVFDAFVDLAGAERWLDYFVARTVDAEGAFEEHFSFLRLRLRTLSRERPTRWVARVEAASLPVGTRMLETLDLTRGPRGTTNLRWRFFYDPHPATAAVEPAITRLFDAWLRGSTQHFVRFIEADSGIRRQPARAGGKLSPMPSQSGDGPAFPASNTDGRVLHAPRVSEASR
jgi:hypothetical protein